MTHGIDTDFLVAAEISNHPFHPRADALIRSLLDAGHDFALAPQTLAEFVHVVTDARRMPQPLTMLDAIVRAETWWEAEEVIRVFPNGGRFPISSTGFAAINRAESGSSTPSLPPRFETREWTGSSPTTPGTTARWAALKLSHTIS